MKLDSNVFLLAAQAISPEGVTLNNGLELHASFACRAIKRTKYLTLTTGNFEDPPEMQFFVAMFLDGDKDATDPSGTCVKFGGPYQEASLQREHRVMALLLCWAMASKP